MRTEILTKYTNKIEPFISDNVNRSLLQKYTHLSLYKYFGMFSLILFLFILKSTLILCYQNMNICSNQCITISILLGPKAVDRYNILSWSGSQLVYSPTVIPLQKILHVETQFL